MTTTQRSTVVGAFDNPQEAERAIEQLRRDGFPRDEIGFVVRNGEATEVATARAGGRADQAAAVGAVTGGILGGLVGAVAALSIPGAGPVLVAGLLAGIVAGGATGFVSGGLLGALIGLGIPEEEARYYEGAVREGEALVIVRASRRSAEAAAILRRSGAKEMSPSGAAAAPRAEKGRDGPRGE